MSKKEFIDPRKHYDVYGEVEGDDEVIGGLMLASCVLLVVAIFSAVAFLLVSVLKIVTW